MGASSRRRSAACPRSSGRRARACPFLRRGTRRSRIRERCRCRARRRARRASRGRVRRIRRALGVQLSTTLEVARVSPLALGFPTRRNGLPKPGAAFVNASRSLPLPTNLQTAAAFVEVCPNARRAARAPVTRDQEIGADAHVERAHEPAERAQFRERSAPRRGVPVVRTYSLRILTTTVEIPLCCVRDRRRSGG